MPGGLAELSATAVEARLVDVIYIICSFIHEDHIQSPISSIFFTLFLINGIMVKILIFSHKYFAVLLICILC